MLPANFRDTAFLATAAEMEIVDLQILNMMEGGDEVVVTFVLEAKRPN